MKSIFLFPILLIPLFCVGQHFFPLTVDPTRDYKVSGQDSVVEYFDEKVPITADLAVTNWGDDPYKMYVIRFAEGRKKGDTIFVKIYETNTIYDFDYSLKIVKDKFFSKFWYQTTIDTAVRKIETIETRLMLKTVKLKKGSILTGYTEYKGQCVTLFDKNEIYIVKGTFRVRLK